MDRLSSALNYIAGLAWGWPTIAILVGTGLFLTFRLLFVQVRHLAHAVACVCGKYDQPEESGDITHFKALATALATPEVAQPEAARPASCDSLCHLRWHGRAYAAAGT